jgi:ceramide glucosyltransferase
MGTFPDALEAILAILTLLGGLYGLFALWFVVAFFRLPRYSPEEPLYPPVSILKPMKGIDPECLDNIASFAAQEYPEYEVLLGFNDASDEGLPLASDIAKSSGPRVRVVIHSTCLGANPKVSNLHGLLCAARYPLLLISDSDIRVNRTYLKEIVGEYLARENVGIVTSLPKIPTALSVGAALESLTNAADFIPSVLVAKRLEGLTFGLGPSMIISQERLQEIGGLPTFADYLAEDYQIGNHLWKKGYKNILSAYLIENVVGRMPILDYLVHQIRWARTYRACRPRGFIGYGITHMFPFSLFFLILHGPTAFSLAALAGVLVLRFSLALAVSRKAGYPSRWLRWLWLLPAKDLLSFGIWLRCFWGSHIFWRGSHYKLLKHGLMRKV